MEGLINAISYFVRDMLKLRILTVAAASCVIVYFYFQPEPLMACVYWNLFFVLQNLVWIVHLLVRRRPPAPSPGRRPGHGRCLPRGTEAGDR